jgi:hypothetical protein
MIQKIPFRSWTGQPDLEVEIGAEFQKEPDGIKLGAAVKVAFKNGAKLDFANLNGANLDFANLNGAKLVGTNLIGANLDFANLNGAKLVGTNLIGANLDFANLNGAKLVGAKLVCASLVGASLVGANLYGASLVGTNLYGANLDGALWGENITITLAPIQIFIPGYWSIWVLDRHMQIGCEIHTFDEWAAFDDRRIMEMDKSRALKFWRSYKPVLMAMCATRSQESEKKAAE